MGVQNATAGIIAKKPKNNLHKKTNKQK